MDIRVIPLRSFVCFEAFLRIGMMKCLRHCFGVYFRFISGNFKNCKMERITTVF